MKDFSGVFTALVTPFKDGEIDWGSLERLVQAQLQGGVDGFVVCGTTGESPTLSYQEKEKLFAFVRSASGGKVPLVMGTGSNSTSDTVEATRAAAKWGADAALVVVPYYNKPSQRGLFQHYQKVAECSDLPVILYNVPGRTITKLELDTIVELSRLPKVIGIKEATGDIGFGKQVIDGCGKDFLVTSGDDGTFIDLIGVGGRGVISVASHIMPKEFVSWCHKAMAEDKSVRNEFDRIRDLNNYLYVEANPIPVKMALHLMGLIDSPELRLPLTRLAEPYMVELKSKMKTAGLL
jgi:4-hydroxy-tetrahydrodipicolinate synthase